jgi:hypothetical protein
MDMKTVQLLQKQAKEAERELRSKIQEKCETDIVDILKMAGIKDVKVCGKDISRLADTWHSNIMQILEQFDFIN